MASSLARLKALYEEMRSLQEERELIEKELVRLSFAQRPPARSDEDVRSLAEMDTQVKLLRSAFWERDHKIRQLTRKIAREAPPGKYDLGARTIRVTREGRVEEVQAP